MKKKRIVSIDYGLKRIGLAISDENQIIARALGVVQAEKNSAETIKKILETLKPYEIEKIIVGHPIHMNGKIGFLADEVQHFVTLLRTYVLYEVALFDERLSSVQAERSLMEGGMRRKDRAKVIDTVSAVIVLQCYLGY